MERKLKNILKRSICVALALIMILMLAACGGDDSATQESDTAAASEVTDMPNSEIIETGDNGENDLRVLITSDVHHTTLNTWYGITSELRMSWWVEAIKKEHASAPIDLIIIAGDTSLDHYSDKGTYTTQKVSTTKTFMDKYAAALPEEIPVYVLPGNHEQYSNAQWKQLTGNDRQFTVEMKGNLFVCLDNYNSKLEPNRTGDPDYTPTDISYVKEQMEKYPDCKNVWLVAHMFDPDKETEDFKSLLKNEKRIKGLFCGHTHQNSVISLGKDFGGKKIAQTGNYSYTWYTAIPETINIADVKNSFWGFRELNITSESAISNYIIAKTKGPVVGLERIDLNRRTVESVRYY